MGFKCGIVGLPNVGKSTLFNALLATQQAQAANYPFCTIEPNVGVVPVGDARMDALVKTVQPKKVVPTTLQFGTQLCEAPNTVRGWFDPACPILIPNPTAMGLLLTSPVYLLGLPVLRWFRSSRLVTGAVFAVLLVALVNLMHFSQGWVQFGYRFSNDFVPWALLLVAIGLDRVASRATAPTAWPITTRLVLVLAVGLVALSVLVNFWGVVWGDSLGW